MKHKDKVSSYGNSAEYLVARIARDRPDILEKMKAGEYRSVRQGAIDAGIIAVPHPDDGHLEALLRAWRRADKETRSLFLWLIEDDDFPALLKKGPSPYAAASTATCPADVESRIAAGESVSAVARSLGVSYRTLARWRAGRTKPRTKRDC
jgi:hypothetical protein